MELSNSVPSRFHFLSLVDRQSVCLSVCHVWLFSFVFTPIVSVQCHCARHSTVHCADFVNKKKNLHYLRWPGHRCRSMYWIGGTWHIHTSKSKTNDEDAICLRMRLRQIFLLVAQVHCNCDVLSHSLVVIYFDFEFREQFHFDVWIQMFWSKLKRIRHTLNVADAAHELFPFRKTKINDEISARVQKKSKKINRKQSAVRVSWYSSCVVFVPTVFGSTLRCRSVSWVLNTIHEHTFLTRGVDIRK